MTRADRTGSVRDDPERAPGGGRVGTWLRDPALDREVWSEGLCRILGRPAPSEGDVQRAFLAAVHPEDVSLVVEALARVERDGQVDPVEFRVRRDGGDDRTVVMEAVAIDDPTRSAPASVLTLLDVTEERNLASRTELALRQSEDRFRRAFQANPDPMTITTLEDGRFVEVNDSFLELTGLSRDGVVGRTTRNVIWSTREARAAFVRRLQRDGSVRDLEIEVRLPSGPTRLFRISAELIELAGEPHVLAISTDITERKRVEEALRKREESFRSVIDNVQDVITVIDAEGRVTYASPALRRILGYRPEDAVGGKFVAWIHPDDRADAEHELSTAFRHRGRTGLIVARFRHRDGTWRTLETVGTILMTADGVANGVLNSRDVSERKRLEEQLRQSQKLEAIGRLAGGLAHDFNNMLTVFGGFANLIEEHPGLPEVVQRSAREIREANERGATLTRQLLAFARRQVLKPEVLDLNGVVRDMRRFLHRLIGEDIEFKVDLDERVGAVLADPGQLQQVVMNLVVNARDAMPTGGELRISTASVKLARPIGSGEMRLDPGEYALMTVRDTGRGMDERVRERIFEPFFTTKPQGKGTGLGLAMVYGIVEQSGGRVIVESEVGRGTSVYVYLPATERVTPGPARRAAGDVRRGSETILVVEDDDAVRRLVCAVLRGQGYDVLDASSGTEALRLAESRRGPIDLLLTDVVMPTLGGEVLARKFYALRPRSVVLFMSGYTDDRFGAELDPSIDLLVKPFTPGVLIRRVRELLDSVP